MSDSDIYKSREPVPQAASDDPRFRKGRRRRSSSLRTFDEQDRKRRSKNSGLRRLLHLFRKSDNEKHFWWGILAVTVVLLVSIAIWQFLYMEYVARKQARQDERYELIHSPESAAE